MLVLKSFFRFKYMVAVAAMVFSSVASAAITYVGNWQVDEGPNWSGSPPNGPLAYTGQEAAALLFGGVASDYVISTVDSNPANIDYQAWYSIIGVSGGTKFAYNYASKYLGSFYGPTSGYTFGDIKGAASAYVWDNAQGSQFKNYAFSIAAVPEPGTYTMMLVGLGLIGSFARRRMNYRA